MTDWIAVCAPGRKLITTLNALFWEETVADVRESPVLEGNTVVLINADLDRELQEQLDGMPFDVGGPLRPEAMYDWRMPVTNPGDGWKLGGLT